MNDLRAMLIRHEGLRLKPYLDGEGKLTVGVGRNLDDVGLTEHEAMFLLTNDIDRVTQEAVSNFAWFRSLNLTRQNVVLDMIFNVGLEKFKEFARTIAAIIVGDFNKAADEMLLSRWAGQVGLRATELAQMMRTGFYPTS